LLASLQAFLSPTVLGSKIDQLCSEANQNMEQLVRNAMASAFSMVDAALSFLNAPSPRAEAVELMGFLFAKYGLNPQTLLNNGELGQVTQVLRQIKYRYEREVLGDNTFSTQDVVSMIFHH
jgi:hypothetical protein